MDITLRPARPADAEEMARRFADEADPAQSGGHGARFPLAADQSAGSIELGVRAENEKVRRLYRRAGFGEEGKARDAMLVGDRRDPAITMSLLRPGRAVQQTGTAAA